MSDHQYVAWFRDLTLQPEDQDYEWCACFIIEAVNNVEAQLWGDRLSMDHSRRREGHEQFLRSYLDQEPWPVGKVPRIIVGELTSDEVIGW